MNSVEVALWLDERIYHAMQLALLENGYSVESKAQAELNRVACEVIGAETYGILCADIQTERMAEEQAQKGRETYCAFRVVENGEVYDFKTKQLMDLLRVAYRLRSYLRNENTLRPFHANFLSAEGLEVNEYDILAVQYLSDAPAVSGVYHIDLDAETVSVLHRTGKWRTFTTKRISAAAYYAARKHGASAEYQQEKFLEHLGEGALQK